MKKKFALIGLFLLLPVLSWAGASAPNTMPIREFGGIDSDSDSLFLGRRTPDSCNVQTDVGPGFLGRNGFVDFSTEPSSGFFFFNKSDGTKYFITKSSNTLKATSGGASFTTTVSTIPLTGRIGWAQLGDYFYWVSATDGLKRWDGTTVTVASQALTCTSLVANHSRLWATGKSGSPRTIFISAFNDGTSWDLVTNPADTDPVQLVRGGALDESLVCLFGPFQDKTIWFKNHSFGAIYGTDRSDFSNRTFSREVGTAYTESVRDCDGLLRWLGPSRTIWEFDGRSFSPKNEISRYEGGGGIRTLMATVLQGDAANQSYSFTTQADFAGGNSLYVSTTITAGSVVLSTTSLWSTVDTSSTNFLAGTFAGAEVTSSGRLIFNRGIRDFSFEDSPSVWTLVGVGISTSSDRGYNGSISLKFTAMAVNPKLYIYNTSDAIVKNCGAFSGGSDSWAQRVCDVSGIAGTVAYALFHDGGANSARSSTFTVLTSSMIWFSYATGTNDLYIDYVSVITSGSFVSQNFDTAYSSPAWMASTATFTSLTHQVTWQTQSSTSTNGAWGDLSSWSTGYAPASAFKKFIRYKVSIGTTTDGSALPYIDDVALIARSSTGSWVSPSIDASGMSGHSIFSAGESLDGGTITYGFYTDTDSVKTITNGVPVVGTYTSSQTITSGTIPTLSTGSYIFGSATYAITLSTQNPTMTEMNFAWNTGSTLDVASIYTGQRYWLGVAISSSLNNTWLVFDRNREWQRWGWPYSATVAGVYNSNPYFGNAQGIWQMDTGNSDAGAAITAYYKTPTYAPSGLNLYSTYHDLFMTTENSDSTVAVTFQIDKRGTDYSLGSSVMNSHAGLQNIKFPFPFSQVQQGRYIDFKWTISSVNAWRILAADLEYYSDKYAP